MILLKQCDFLVAQEQKLSARGHWALLAHSPESDQHEISPWTFNVLQN